MINGSSIDITANGEVIVEDKTEGAGENGMPDGKDYPGISEKGVYWVDEKRIRISSK